jgi:hypothetical protein
MARARLTVYYAKTLYTDLDRFAMASQKQLVSLNEESNTAGCQFEVNRESIRTQHRAGTFAL